MSQPITLPGNPSGKARRANWLGRYLEVEKRFDKELKAALLDATKGIDEALVELAGKKTISARTRRLQLSLAHKEIRNQMNYLFGDIGNLVRSHRAKAAVAAVDAALLDESKLLARMFKDPIKRKAYADSLRATAERNIEAVVTRVLHTQQPLSRRVYKTRALANGLVSSAINRGLARGDSADDIARAVHNLIDPNTPGGVSYAAIRLGRTEINNAFHAQAILDAQQKPWVTHMRWHLSKVHQEQGCVCEDYAAVGLFALEHVPPKPHPNCRCYVTPEAEDYEDFENSLVQGHYDSYLEDILDASEGKQPAPVAMVPSPPEAKTTKADQPEGWTGPPVAKAAANTQVRQIEDDFWVKYMEQKKFLNEAREGSRKMQINGYRGGLSAQGKKNLLAQEQGLIADKKIALDIGREMTARVAYAEPSKASVYRAMQLSQEDIERIKNASDGISMPLSTFFKTDKDALSSVVPNQFGEETVIFELAEGAKLAEVGDLRLTLGEFQVNKLDWVDHENGRSLLVRMKQIDTREFDAEKPWVGELEFFDLAEELAKKTPAGTGNSTATAVARTRKPKNANKIEWTGPKIAKPNTEIDSDIFNIWQQGSFEDTAIYIREGAREAIENGYKGIDTNTFRMWARKIPEDVGEYIGPQAKDALREVGGEMVSRVVHADIVDRDLWRGVRYSDESLAALKKGGVVDLPLSSFGVKDTALEYASIGDFSSLPPALNPYDGLNQVIFRLEKGAKATQVLGRGDAEWVTFGQFEVVGTKKVVDQYIGEYTEIHIRHVSLTRADELVKEPVSLREAIQKSKSVTEIRTLMKEKHQLTFTRFNEDHVDIRSAKETMIALDEMLDKHPLGKKSLTHVEVWKDSDMETAYAHVQPYWDGSTRLRLNTRFTSDYPVMQESKEKGEKVGWATKGAGEQPWRGTIIHEYGHVLDWAASRHDMHNELPWTIAEVAKKYIPEYTQMSVYERKEAMRDWLRGTGRNTDSRPYNGAGPSGYAVHLKRPKDPNELRLEEWGFNPPEMVAESFTDVERNGNKANEVSRAVHKLLMDFIKKKEEGKI